MSLAFKWDLALQGSRRGGVLVWAESDGAPKQEDETSRREEARIAALEKLTRSGPEQKKRQQTAMKRVERQAAAPVRFRQPSCSACLQYALRPAEEGHRVLFA